MDLGADSLVCEMFYKLISFFSLYDKLMPNRACAFKNFGKGYVRISYIFQIIISNLFSLLCKLFQMSQFDS
ncbi:hypothetical protein SDC9_190355 [bioreactor metagenome]|uniref:Uncharacterized protein n=1 Tax=bioreactor metagenome TaxID=1076179 RepID=A0A645HUZ4_9ZZZZ